MPTYLKLTMYILVSRLQNDPLCVERDVKLYSLTVN